ncbi:MAG: rRNA adenine N-6-methyltransferase family protein [Pseudomonadota bacterium]
MKPAKLQQARRFYAALMAGASHSSDPRFENIVRKVPREDFLGPGPWKVVSGRRYIDTPDANPEFLYQNVLVALDVDRRINNGEPFLHARWIDAVDPQPGEHVSHIGAGTGYYSALLSKFVEPGGHVDAYEIDGRLATEAKHNLEPYANVTALAADAVTHLVKASDLIYVNAGIAELPAAWIKALKPGGRMIFPWCPMDGMGLALLITARKQGLDAKPLMPVAFIPCSGAGRSSRSQPELDLSRMWKVRSVLSVSDREPDETAVAIFGEFWFSTDLIGGDA